MQLLRECWSFLTKLMTCQNLQNKLLNITVLFIWYSLASLKKMSPAKHAMASSISFWWVLVSVHSPFWRVFEKNGFPHCYDQLCFNWLKFQPHVWWNYFFGMNVPYMVLKKFEFFVVNRKSKMATIGRQF